MSTPPSASNENDLPDALPLAPESMIRRLSLELASFGSNQAAVEAWYERSLTRFREIIYQQSARPLIEELARNAAQYQANGETPEGTEAYRAASMDVIALKVLAAAQRSLSEAMHRARTLLGG